MEHLSLLSGSSISFLSIAIAGQNDRGHQQLIISAATKRFPPIVPSLWALCSARPKIILWWKKLNVVTQLYNSEVQVFVYFSQCNVWGWSVWQKWSGPNLGNFTCSFSLRDKYYVDHCISSSAILCEYFTKYTEHLWHKQCLKDQFNSAFSEHNLTRAHFFSAHGNPRLNLQEPNYI